MTTASFRQLLQANLLAIISVLIAVASLSYNTWRNDVSELNRNQRAAGFAVLQELAKLQLLVDHLTYDDKRQRGDTIEGWTRIVFIGDLASLTSPKVDAGAKSLRQQWESEVGRLESSEAANAAISRSVESLRLETLRTLSDLR
ncbi:hypothetical protein [Ferribacterium limneticum]|uniref:hypothetical protein n=1 Tax=Ferribacterium limneticum TaxID=76259 RepID=UPI001CF94B83|nr:hypothetical protein [Ferribacterium limneticum]UCV18246.1 hypothetical protein KI610_15775 [Ferribacterium limneticum]